ncbi:MAG: site-specific DNA-methyltransferase, partial [Lachnospiraceae bacterium]|nr:site-specific DNA-methyltransferase [Lachnospiraceae bacterium]
MSKILCGDAVEMLRKLPDESVDTCVTSPPYYGLRDYGEDKQIGVEQTPYEYVERLVKVFDEVNRVLKKDGTLWVNIGDSYAGSGKGPSTICKHGKNKDVFDIHNRIYGVPKTWNGIKPKDLIGIPWMLAFALRERGWYLRSDIIWHKTNCLPESAKDRPTKCHEYVFLLSKSRTYFFNYIAIREPLKDVSKQRYKRGRSNEGKYVGTQGISNAKENSLDLDQQYRRKRDVWEVSTNSYRMDEHFAMFPEKLIEPCILAGSRAGGIVLDPFFGSGTTGAVAKRLGREYIGIDLNERYCIKAQERIDKV